MSQNALFFTEGLFQWLFKLLAAHGRDDAGVQLRACRRGFGTLATE